jgi:hypothetical protein
MRTRTATPVRFLGVLTTVLVVAGCANPYTTPTASTTPGSTAGTATISTTPAAPTTADLGADLSTVLLRATDLPSGWKELPLDTDSDGSCLDQVFGRDVPLDPAVRQAALFGESEIGPFLVAWVVAAPAEQELVALNDVLVSCDGSTSPSGFTTAIDPTPVPGLPQNSLSVHGTDIDSSGSQLAFTIAASGTYRTTVMVFAIAPVGEISDVLVAGAVTAMFERAERL